MDPCIPVPAGVILVAGTDDITRGLLRVWLTEAGWQVVDADRIDARPEAALMLIDIAFPRRAAPVVDPGGVPVLALSATFHSSVERSGPVARALGVAGVLPKPVRREALVAAVHALASTSSR